MSATPVRSRRARGGAWFFAALFCVLLLGACGGGGDTASGELQAPAIAQFAADKASYFVGEQARLTATFSGGTGRIEPGSIPVTSGETVTTPVLTERRNFRLIVTRGNQQATRDLALPVGYRERTRAVAAPFTRSEHAAVILDDGDVLIVGGEDGTAALPTSAFRFDVTTETFTRFADLAAGRVGHAAVSLPDGDVLVIGGVSGLALRPAAEIISGRTGQVRATIGTPVDRQRVYAHALLLANGRVLVTGGNGLAPAELFDPVTEQFRATTGAMVAPRYRHTATRLSNGRVLIYGGIGAGGAALPAEIYDPTTDRFTTLGLPETKARFDHAALGMPDGSLWIVGGEDEDGNVLASVLRFDPANNTFTRLPDLQTARRSVPALLLTDEHVFVGGGDPVGTAAATDTTELLSASGLRRGGPLLAAARSRHTVTPLITTGRVLVFGGVGADRRVVAGGEILE